MTGLTRTEAAAAIRAIRRWPNGVRGDYYFSDQWMTMSLEDALSSVKKGKIKLEHG